MVLMALEATILKGVLGFQENPIDLIKGYKTPDDQTNLIIYNNI